MNRDMECCLLFGTFPRASKLGNRVAKERRHSGCSVRRDRRRRKAIALFDDNLDSAQPQPQAHLPRHGAS